VPERREEMFLVWGKQVKMPNIDVGQSVTLELSLSG